MTIRNTFLLVALFICSTATSVLLSNDDPPSQTDTITTGTGNGHNG